jgi:hypothetical protein
MLTEEQLEEFESCRQLGTAKERKAWFESYHESIETTLPQRIRSFMNNSQLDFIIFGIFSKVNFWQPQTI